MAHVNPRSATLIKKRPSAQVYFGREGCAIIPIHSTSAWFFFFKPTGPVNIVFRESVLVSHQPYAEIRLGVVIFPNPEVFCERLVRPRKVEHHVVSITHGTAR